MQNFCMVDREVSKVFWSYHVSDKLFYKETSFFAILIANKRLNQSKKVFQIIYRIKLVWEYYREIIKHLKIDFDWVMYIYL